MTPEADQVDRHVHVTPLSRDEVAAILGDWARAYPPSRFVVYGISDDPDVGGYDGTVIAWGLGFDDHVYVQAVDSLVGGSFSSADSMRRILFRRDRDIRLLWIDPEPEPET